jgi:hypothetical protein
MGASVAEQVIQRFEGQARSGSGVLHDSSPYVVPPSIPVGMTIAEYRSAQRADRARRGKGWSLRTGSRHPAGTMRAFAVAVGALLAMLILVAPASAVKKNVRLVDNLPGAQNATALNFLKYEVHRRNDTRVRGRGRSLDVMLVNGRFGLKTYSLADPAHPRLLGELTAEQLRLPGDPPVDWTLDADGDPISTFWEGEDMAVDRKRKLAIMSRDPRAFAGSTTNQPGDPNTNNATNIAGVYAVDVKDPRKPRILSFQQLPTGHTTTCINDCKWLWTGGPFATTAQETQLGWTFGRPIIVTDLRDPGNPRGHPQRPVDLFRLDGVTAYSHDVQVDDAGIAWVSGDGGIRGYWTTGRHRDPLTGQRRRATPLNPVPYAGGGLPQSVTDKNTGGFMHNSWRPIGKNAPKGDPRYRRGRLLLGTEEDFGPAAEGCSQQGMFSIASLAGSFGGQAWRQAAAAPFRLKVVGKWYPFRKQGSRPPSGPFNSQNDFCSAHYFDVRGSVLSYAWYGEGTRFLDISDPANPRQFAYWRPNNSIVFSASMHKGYVYTADQVRGVDVLRLTGGALRARKSGRDLVAPPQSRKQQQFLARLARQLKADPAAAGLCFLPAP